MPYRLSNMDRAGVRANHTFVSNSKYIYLRQWRRTCNHHQDHGINVDSTWKCRIDVLSTSIRWFLLSGRIGLFLSLINVTDKWVKSFSWYLQDRSEKINVEQFFKLFRRWWCCVSLYRYQTKHLNTIFQSLIVE